MNDVDVLRIATARYEEGRDSVLEVEEGDYDKCNTDTPIRKMGDGYSVFELDRFGSFHFISGNRESCEKGQKIVVVVVTVRNQSTPVTAPVAKGCPSTAKASPPVTPVEESPPTPSDPVTAPAARGCPSTAKAPPPVAPPITPPEVSPPTPSDATSYGCPNTPPANVAPVAEPPNKGSPVLPPNTTSSDVAPVAEPDEVASNISPPSPPPGEGCNISDIRSDPANVPRKPPKSFAAAPAGTRISVALVVAILLTICI
ncbi:unnamed protein product [Cuscuta campestris]|uniref:Phytocyanin domain-containing protein n=1 Tax=Cuscuta campestris TaxID=132261 RepID=A0A484L9U0_9ASTE|nr:unnamed protein product [Cuscuta campestris]